MNQKDTLVDRVLIIIVVAWVGAIGIHILDRTFKIPDTVHLLMSAAATYLLSGRGARKIKDDDHGPRPPNP